VGRCLKEVGIGFMFAPSFHPAMKYAGPPRREIGIRTVFNILGPLTNPAGAQAQVLGVADGALVEKMARVLRMLGCKHALVVHSEDGLDELTVTGKTNICEVKGDNLRNYTITPEEVGLPRARLEDLKGGTAAENAAMLRDILGGTVSPVFDAVLLNAAAALLASERVETLADGVRLARGSIGTGRAMQKLEGLIQLTQSYV